MRVSSWLSRWEDGGRAVACCVCGREWGWDIPPPWWLSVGKDPLKHSRKSPKVPIGAEFQGGGQVGTDLPHGENWAPAEFGAHVQ